MRSRIMLEADLLPDGALSLSFNEVLYTFDELL